MVRKRYTDADAARLLARVLDVTEAIPTVKGTRSTRVARGFVKNARGPLVELITARLGNVVVHESVTRDVRGADGARIVLWARGLRANIIRDMAADDADVMTRRGVWTFPQEHLTAYPEPHGYRFELVDTPAAMLLLQVLQLIQIVGADRLTQCDCDRLFVCAGKRKFCSARCQKRVYMREVRSGDRWPSFARKRIEPHQRSVNDQKHGARPAALTKGKRQGETR